MITNFKTDRYLNNLKEHLFEILRLKPQYQTPLQNFFLLENEAIKHDLVEFKVQCLKVFRYHGNKLPSCFFIQFLEQLLKFLVYFILLKYVNYMAFSHKRADFGLQILDLKDHFSAFKRSSTPELYVRNEPTNNANCSSC